MSRLAWVLVFALGCARTPPIQRISVIDWPAISSVKVEITNTKPDCYFPDPPAEIEEPAWPSVEEDLYRRQYVHRRDFADVVSHVRDQDQRISSLVECVKALTTPR